MAPAGGRGAAVSAVTGADAAAAAAAAVSAAKVNKPILAAPPAVLRAIHFTVGDAARGVKVRGIEWFVAAGVDVAAIAVAAVNIDSVSETGE